MMRENTHMEHLEDYLFESRDLTTRLMHGEVKFTRKWDGAPSIFFGRDEDGRAWIARKGLFNKDAKKYYTRKDFDLDPKFPEDLKIPLWNTLVYLDRAYVGPELNGFFVQGDLMFTDGAKDGTFHPNTIKYVTSKIPSSAKVGIVWHTKYIADGIYYGANIKEFFRNTSELWMINAHDEIEDFVPDMFVKFPNVGNYSHLSDKTIMLFKTYQNAKIKGHADGSLIDFVFDHMERSMDSVKMEKTKAKRMDEYKTIFVELMSVPNLESDYAKLTEYKMFLLGQFDALPSDYKAMLVKADGTVQDTYHEGYAVFDDHGNAAKIVDRDMFSRANFSDEYVKGWS